MPFVVDHKTGASFVLGGKVAMQAGLGEYRKWQSNNQLNQQRIDLAYDQMDQQSWLTRERMEQQERIQEDQQAHQLETGYARSQYREQAAERAQQQGILGQKELYDYKLDSSQKRKKEQYAKAREAVRSDPNLSEKQRQEALRKINFADAGLEPQWLPKPDSPFPLGKGIGEQWTDEESGIVYTRDKTGLPKELHNPVKLRKEFDVKMTTQIVKAAKDIMESHKVKDDLSGAITYRDDMTYQKAMRMAWEMYGKNSGMTPPPPVTGPQLQEEILDFQGLAEEFPELSAEQLQQRFNELQGGPGAESPVLGEDPQTPGIDPQEVAAAVDAYRQFNLTPSAFPQSTDKAGHNLSVQTQRLITRNPNDTRIPKMVAALQKLKTVRSGQKDAADIKAGADPGRRNRVNELLAVNSDEMADPDLMDSIYRTLPNVLGAAYQKKFNKNMTEEKWNEAVDPQNIFNRLLSLREKFIRRYKRLPSPEQSIGLLLKDILEGEKTRKKTKSSVQ